LSDEGLGCGKHDMSIQLVEANGGRVDALGIEAGMPVLAGPHLLVGGVVLGRYVFGLQPLLKFHLLMDKVFLLNI
jgi:hypothetical protein